MALLILFVLVIVSAVFVALLSRNFAMTSRSREASTAQELAGAGMDYADQMLTTSPLGADWRPPAPPAANKVAGSYSTEPVYDAKGNLVPNPVWRPLVLPVEIDPDHAAYYDDNEIAGGLDPQPVYDKPATDPTRVLVGYMGGFAKYPDPREVPPAAAGDGYFLLKVEYASTATEPLSRYIRITSVGHSLRNPLLLRSLVAYKPIGITEYVRFVTNADRSGRDNDWGIAPWIDYNNDSSNNEQYLDPVSGNPTANSIYKPEDRTAITDLYGPVRFQGDVFFRGASRFFLWPTGSSRYRNDKIEIVGKLDYSEVDTSMGSIVEFYDNSAGGTWVPVYNISPPPGEKNSAFTYQDSQGDVVLRRGVRRIAAPDIFAKDPATGVRRYEALTRRSGPWIRLAGRDRNTGEFAYWQDFAGVVHFPTGCFVANSSDIQFGHNLGQLRDNYLRPGTDVAPGPYWDASAIYTPPGVIIGLQPGRLDPASGQYDPPATWSPLDPNYADYPKIVLTRTDGQQFKAAVWDLVAGAYVEQDVGATLELPYPRNGVIYCDGNVRVSGTLPRRNRINTQLPYPPDPVFPIENLTVVSGGTIYIEASLLTPQASDPGIAPENSSSIGLLARDMVVLNPTASGRAGGGTSTIILNGDVSVEANATGSQDGHYEIRPGGSFVLRSEVVNSLSDPTILTLTHCGADPGPTVINIIINGQYLDLDGDPLNGIQYQYTFTSSPSVLPGNPTTSNHLSPDFETRSWNVTAYLNRNPGDVNYITLQLDPSSSTSYWLGNFKMTSEIQVGGGPAGGGGVLCYAQDGSWFVIPGKYYGDPSDPLMTGDKAVQELRYNTPIYFRGAIAESHPADSPAVADWVKKWSHPRWLTGDPPEKPHWGTIKYEYDDDLINNRRGALPILPALPVSPDLIYEREE